MERNQKIGQRSAIWAMVAAIIVIVLSLTGCVDGCERNPGGNGGVVDPNDFVWRVAPELEYEKIYYCGCGFYGTEPHSGYGIDTKTGLIGDNEHYGHGGGPIYYLYDENKDLYGYYGYDEGGEFFEMLTAGDFAINFPWGIQRLNAYQKIDSDKVKKIEEEGQIVSYDISAALISEKYAVAFGTTFVTEFIYDYFDRDEYIYVVFETPNIIAMQLDGKWGILDKDGKTAVPFSFEEILLIDDETAFAKINGKYGIIDVKKTAGS